MQDLGPKVKRDLNILLSIIVFGNKDIRSTLVPRESIATIAKTIPTIALADCGEGACESHPCNKQHNHTGCAAEKIVVGYLHSGTSKNNVKAGKLPEYQYMNVYRSLLKRLVTTTFTPIE